VNINLHIERLVLEGVPLRAGGGSIVQAAIESEMRRLMTAGDSNPSVLNGRALPVLRAPSIQADAGCDARALGRYIARSIHAGVCHE
jgi:hypothetical protein